MKFLYTFILILVFSCSDTKSRLNTEKLITPKIDTVRYKYHGFNMGLRLDLLSDGRFINEDYSFSCFGGGERKIVFGRYKMDSLSVKLIPETITLTTYQEDIVLKPTETKLKYGVDSLKIKTEFQIVKWEGNNYLLSNFYDFSWLLEKENDYMRFADYLNSGDEPTTSGMYLAKKNKDSITSGFDINQIPEKWQAYFLKKPISVKIKSIKKLSDSTVADSHFWKIEFDKGKKDRVSNRLTLQTEDGLFFIQVDSVLEHRSYGETYMYDFTPKDFPVGTELRTKWH